jgi:hypothetical protein
MRRSVRLRPGSEHLPQTVIALVMVPAADPEAVLVGVRSTEGNARHPGVVSVPTMRFPFAWAAMEIGALPRLRAKPLNGRVGTFGHPGSSSTASGNAVENLLAKKIVDGTLLDAGAVRGRCAFRLAMRGDVDDPTGRDARTEDTLMLTILAICDEGAEAMRGRTNSYSELEWVRGTDLVKAWQVRDGQIVFPDSNPFEVCIRGLCIESAVKLLNDPNQIPALARSKPGP